MKYLHYLNYVIRHRWYVFLECRKLGITWLGLLHDWSNFRPSEFIGCARYFYGLWPATWETDVERPRVWDDFDFARLLHQKRNRHHWPYWVFQTDADGAILLPVPQKYVREMLADWIGASRAQGHGGDIREWWFENRDKIQIDNQAYTWLDMWVRQRR